VRWVDSHCHLDSLEGDLEAALQRSAQAGVKAIVTLGTDIASSREALRLAESNPGVYAAVGIHPHEAEGFEQSWAAEVERLAAAGMVVAIGEVGMDFYRDHTDPAIQRAALSAQLELAKRIGKPLVLHVREAFDAIFELLEAEGPSEGLIFHCFSGDASQAERALELGGYVSFAGNVSYRSAGNLREAAKAVPLERLLVETDSPYLAPVPYRGRPNEPAYVAAVGASLAATLGREPEEVAEATSANASRVFGLPRLL
jgi:TatD DNase family protein